ncbi:MAG: NAD(P)-dependent oxidoreductase [Pseudolysinimonas sp.]|uniref:NAD-dependent epimerase/dehydratase family protein n=1 Tax=Pseudolysinimonas sp. TaxID=2680009 RepID=UPI0032655AA1
MKLLVTGAAGLVGGAIARRAIDLGHDVIRVWNSAPIPALSGAYDVRCDLGNPSAVSSLPSDVTAVIHAAARIPAGDWSDEAAAAVNRRTDDTLLHHYRSFGGAWVYVSSVALESPELRETSSYAREKAATEESTTLAFSDRARSIRISSPYGPGMRHLNVLRRFVEAARAGDPITIFGSGERTQDFVHVDDIATAAIAAAEFAGGEPVVVASGEPVTMIELARLIVRICGSHSTIKYADEPDPQEQFRADYDLGPALDSFDWSPSIRLETGLRSLVEAM